MGSSQAGNTSTDGEDLRFFLFDSCIGLGASLGPLGKFHHPILLVSKTGDLLRSFAFFSASDVECPSKLIRIVFVLPLLQFPGSVEATREFQV